VPIILLLDILVVTVLPGFMHGQAQALATFGIVRGDQRLICLREVR